MPCDAGCRATSLGQVSSESAAAPVDGPLGQDGVSPIEFRDALSRWASGVTVVTARGLQEEPVGMTASSFTALSLEPPLVLVCVDLSAKSHDALVGADGFYVHVLSRGQEHLSKAFARSGPEKFDEVESAGRGAFEAPLLPVGVARLACAHHAAQVLGDHTILVGRVIQTEATDAPPLLYADRGYHGLS